MPVNCNCQRCSHNKEGLCKATKISVFGIYSRSNLGTICETFVSEDMNEKDERELTSKSDNVSINCNSNYCKYNLDGKCVNNTINIGGRNVKYFTQTQCDSFTLKHKN